MGGRTTPHHMAERGMQHRMHNQKQRREQGKLLVMGLSFTRWDRSCVAACSDWPHLLDLFGAASQCAVRSPAPFLRALLFQPPRDMVVALFNIVHSYRSMLPIAWLPAGQQ